MKNYFIVHGTDSHARNHWLGWLEDYLKENGHTVYNLTYPTPRNQNYDNWKAVLNNYKSLITPESVFIGHSIGPIFIIKYIMENKLNIGKLISVCGFNELANPDPHGVNEQIKSFLCENTAPFKDLCNERICFYSDNDPYLKQDALINFVRQINGISVKVPGAKHFNTESGYTKFTQILKYV